MALQDRFDLGDGRLAQVGEKHVLLRREPNARPVARDDLAQCTLELLVAGIGNASALYEYAEEPAAVGLRVLPEVVVVVRRG